MFAQACLVSGRSRGTERTFAAPAVEWPRAVAGTALSASRPCLRCRRIRPGAVSDRAGRVAPDDQASHVQPIRTPRSGSAARRATSSGSTIVRSHPRARVLSCPLKLRRRGVRDSGTAKNSPAKKVADESRIAHTRERRLRMISVINGGAVRYAAFLFLKPRLLIVADFL
jgi:hypothetical protein